MLEPTKFFCRILIVVTFFIQGSCVLDPRQQDYINTEVSCPGQRKVLVSHTLSNEVATAVIKFNEEALSRKERPTYTVFRLKDGRSFQIKIPPQQVIEQCIFREILRASTNYGEYFYYF